MLVRTDFANNLVILQHPPGDIHTIIVPICARHVGIDISIDTGYASGSAARIKRHDVLLVVEDLRNRWVARIDTRRLSRDASDSRGRFGSVRAANELGGRFNRDGGGARRSNDRDRRGGGLVEASVWLGVSV